MRYSFHYTLLGSSLLYLLLDRTFFHLFLSVFIKLIPFYPIKTTLASSKFYFWQKVTWKNNFCSQWNLHGTK